MAWLGATNRSITPPPSKVTGVVAAPLGSSSINVSWGAVAGATTYTIARNGTPVATSAGVSFQDTGLTPSTTYTYTVAANSSRGQGQFSTPPASATTTPFSTLSVKWNPGHWTEGDTKLGTTGTLATIKSEIDAMAAFPNIVGYMILCGWGFLQQAANSYTFTELDNVVAYIKGKGKLWALQVIAGEFNYGTTAPTTASNSWVPAYINNGNTTQWGTAGTRAGGVTTVLSGQSGWWGGDGNGHTYGAALWRPNVMAEWTKLHQALGAKYDSDPACEVIYQGEDSFYQGTGSQNNSDYNDTTQRNGWESFLQAQCAAWPTTNVGFSETFLFTTGSSTILTNYITDTGKPYQNHPPLMAQTDSLGAVQRNAIHTWGSQTYAGLLGTLGDRRPLGRFIAEVQAPDLGFFQNLGSPREDIVAGLDIMGCTHVFWAIVPSPIAVTTKPALYPATFTANVTGTTGQLVSPWPCTSGSYDVSTTAGGKGTFTKGSKSVTFAASQSQGSPTINVKMPMIPFNWSGGGTASATSNGTSSSYTDTGLLAWINDPANALQNSAYPVDYP